jgi:hypothetical protein
MNLIKRSKKIRSLTKHPVVTGCLVIFMIIVTPQCGKKKKNIFSFNEHQKKEKINRLSLPSPQNIKYEENENGIFITWKKINKENIPTFQNENTPKILGYNVYKFLKTRFIPKHPINKKPIPNNSFLDTTSESTKNHFCYAVRAVFLIDNKELEGPLSQVICLN